MRFNAKNAAIANRLRQIIIQETHLISDGEAVAITVLWSFFVDHAEAQGLKVEELAREQLEAFIKGIAPGFKISRIARLH